MTHDSFVRELERVEEDLVQLKHRYKAQSRFSFAFVSSRHRIRRPQRSKIAEIVKMKLPVGPWSKIEPTLHSREI